MKHHDDDGNAPLRPDEASHGKIADSIRCKQCSYDLKGLWSTGRCPECGETIASTLKTIHPDGIQIQTLEEFARGLRISGSSWLAGLLVTILCPCGSFASGWTGNMWPFFSPLVVLFVLTSASRVLSLLLLNRGMAVMPHAPPMPVWLLPGISSLTVITGLTLSALGGWAGWLLLLFAVCLACEGLLWTRFVARCAVALDCPYASPLGRFGIGCWITLLLLIPVTWLLNVARGNTNQFEIELILLWFLAWIACLAGAAFTGLFARGLGDLLPQLVTIDQTDQILEPVESGLPRDIPNPIQDDMPIEVADAPGITIEPEERGRLEPPTPPAEAEDEDEASGYRPDTY